MFDGGVLTGYALYGAAVGGLGWLAGKGFEGLVSNRADRLAGIALGPAWDRLKKLATNDPDNHDLQRAARKAYLESTAELVDQALLSPNSTSTLFDERTTLDQLRRAIADEKSHINDWMPATTLGDLDVLLVSEGTNQADRLRLFRQQLETTLQQDLAQWAPGGASLPSIERLLNSGWNDRTWHGVIALYFVEEIKTQPRVANVFQAEMLARISQQDPRVPARWDDLLAKLEDLPGKVAQEIIDRGLARPTRKDVLEERPPAFTGRADHLARLETALQQPGARVLLYGEPGSGKSTLALQFAWDAKERLMERFGAVVFQTCGQRPLPQVAVELAGRIGVDPSLPPDRMRAEAMAWLASRDALLVLDDVWHDASGIAPPAPARVLYTSRRRESVDLPPQLAWRVGGFTEPEAADFLAESLDAEWMPAHRAELLAFARAADFLPYALAVAARRLAVSVESPARAIAALKVAVLRAGKLDLPRLFQEAVAAQPEPARELLRAFGACSAGGAWLPFAADVAGLDGDSAGELAQDLVNASLLRLVDREEARFGVHPLMHEWLRLTVDPARGERHAAALHRRFESWEMDALDCLRMMDEVDTGLAFLRVGDDWDRFWRLAYCGFELGRRTGLLEPALRFMRVAGEWAESRGDKAGLHASLGNQALILQAWGQLDQAMALHKEQERICRELADKAGLQASLGNQALILKAWGQLDQATALLREEERICRELADKAGLQASLGNQALVLKDWGQLDQAMALLKEQERICRELADKAGLQRSLGNQALILHAWGQLDQAMALHKEEERICRELADKAGLGRSLGNQAVILKAWGQLDQAMALHKEGERICRELADKAGLQASLGNQAVILKAWGQLDQAMALHKEKERICRELADKAGLQASLGNQALILKDWGQLDEAMALFKEQERICRELANRAGLAASLANQGLVMRQQGLADEGTARLREALEIFTELKMPRERDIVRRHLGSMAAGAGE